MREPIEVPTAVSTNVDYRNATWYGFLAPVRTPPTVLQILNVAIGEAGREPDLRAKMRVQGVAPQNVGLADFDRYIRDDMTRLAPILATIAQSN